MAREKVFFDIEMAGADKAIKHLTTIENELKKVAEAKKKEGKATVELKSQEVTLRAEKKRLSAQINKQVRDFNAQKNAVKASATSYDGLVSKNKALSAQLRKLEDPLGRNKVKFQQLSKEMTNNTNKLKKMDGAMGRNFRNVGNYGGALKAVGAKVMKFAAAIGAAIMAVRGMINVMKKSIDLYDKQQLAEVSLKVALGKTSQALLDQAAALQQVTRFGDEATLQGQAFLAQMGLEEDAIIKLTPAILDMAQAKGMDLKNAFDLVAKSVGSSTNALSRYGIEITGVAGSTKRIDSALAALNEKFSGQATAAVGGAGSIIQLGNTFGDLQETIGGIMVNGLEPVIVLVSSFVKGLDNAIEYLLNYKENVDKAKKAHLGLKDALSETNDVLIKLNEAERLQLDLMISTHPILAAQEEFYKQVAKAQREGNFERLQNLGLLEDEIKTMFNLSKETRLNRSATVLLNETQGEQGDTLRKLKKILSDFKAALEDTVIGSKEYLVLQEDIIEAEANLAKALNKKTAAEKEAEKRRKKLIKDNKEILDHIFEIKMQQKTDGEETLYDNLADKADEVIEKNEELVSSGKFLTDQFIKDEDARVAKERALDKQISNEKIALAQQTQDAVANIIGDSINRRTEAELAALEKQKEQNLISEEQFEQKSLEIKRKGFKKVQALKIAEIVSNLATELSGIATNAALNPANALTAGGAGVAQYGILQGIAVARAAINAASVLAQKFEKGGLVGGGVFEGNSHAQGGVKFSSGGRIMEAEGGEAIINRQSTSMYKPLLSAINQAGGGKKFAFGGITPDAQLQSNMLSEAGIGAEIARQMGDIKVVNVVADTTAAQISINNVESEALF